MKILFSPQIVDDEKRIQYKLEEGMVIAEYDGVSDSFDFQNFPDGKLDTETIETRFKVCPIISAERLDGELRVELDLIINADDVDAYFQEWTEHTELPSVEFSSESVAHLNWISKEEQEKKHMLPTDKERIEMLEQAILFLSMEE